MRALLVSVSAVVVLAACEEKVYYEDDVRVVCSEATSQSRATLEMQLEHEKKMARSKAEIAASQRRTAALARELGYPLRSSERIADAEKSEAQVLEHGNNASRIRGWLKHCRLK